ncbi:NAD-P-binding protein [Mycena latifolia]|nr:NAD-P-binding protein [Mycena latifolia]
MPSLSTVRASNATYKPTYLPVGIFLGGTSGIGRGTAGAFARQTNGLAHIILVGRNAAAAQSILESFPKPAPGSTSLPWKHEFVECDASLVRNAHATATALAARPDLPRLHFLVLTAGYIGLGGREDTEEGLDRMLVLKYYSRWAFIKGLLPALRRAREAGEPAGVMTVLGAGRGQIVDLDNLGYTGEGGTYTDLMIEELASRNPTMSFTHTFPGWVKTPLFDFPNPAVRLLVKLVLWLRGNSAADAGEYQLYGLLNAMAGASRRGEHGEEMAEEPVYGRGESDVSRRVWAHTEEVVRACTRV